MRIYKTDEYIKEGLTPNAFLNKEIVKKYGMVIECVSVDNPIGFEENKNAEQNSTYVFAHDLSVDFNCKLTVFDENKGKQESVNFAFTENIEMDEDNANGFYNNCYIGETDHTSGLHGYINEDFRKFVRKYVDLFDNLNVDDIKYAIDYNTFETSFYKGVTTKHKHFNPQDFLSECVFPEFKTEFVRVCQQEI